MENVAWEVVDITYVHIVSLAVGTACHLGGFQERAGTRDG